MHRARWILVGLLLALLVVGCQSAMPDGEMAMDDGMPMDNGMGNGMGMGRMGMNDAMRTAHNAAIPAAYADAQNPVTADAASIERGGDVYVTHCAVCHGDGGMGDGPAGQSIDPPAAQIAHTSQMMSDAYLYWRISEGGLGDPLQSAMPAWKDLIDEQTRWDLINYVHALGAGTVEPRMAQGGARNDPAAERAQHAIMLALATDQGVIDAAEAALFDRVHSALDAQPQAVRSAAGGTMLEALAQRLDLLVEDGSISRADADSFMDIHARITDAGLMQ